MAAENENYLFSKMSTVLSYSIDGFTRADLEQGQEKFDNIEKEVSKHVRAIVNALKTSHKKFEDPDFGPSDKDQFGALSLYGAAPPAPAGTSKYPAPETLKWERPQYSDDQVGEEDEEGDEDEDDEFGDFGGGDRDGGEEVWCMHGELFIDGSSSGDVIQGNLGDCWYLGALSVLGTDESLLKKCFWKETEFKEFGLFVCVFYKDCALRFVIIDDRIPVFSNSGKVVFAHCKDPNELWVLLIEKAYAKLHGCYKALIGGYVHLGLGDLTGFSPRLIGMRPGYMGYSDPIEEDQLWHMLRRYQTWKCLMGTSIQSKPGQGAKVEANAGQGLIMGHAYSFLAAGELEIDGGEKVRLVKLRNPWGKGEWTGAWSDNSAEYEKYADALNKDTATFGEATDGMNDGTFFMKFDDWRVNYTNIFVAMNFPKDWQGQIVKGSWDGESGGPREMTTWMSNSKIKFTLPKHTDELRASHKCRRVFINLFIGDTRLTMGKEYYKDPLYKVGVSFDVVCEDEFNDKFKDRQDADGSVRMKYGWVFQEEEGADVGPNPINVKQPPYMFGTTQLEAMVEVDKAYYIVPSVRNRKLAGAYYVQIYSDGDIVLANSGKDTALAIEKDVKEMTVGNKKVHLTKAQFFEKTEAVREKLIGEMSRLGKNLDDIAHIFYGQKDVSKSTTDLSATGGVHKGVPRTEFKRRLMEMGFSLADFPDEDFIVLDENNDGSIDGDEFTAFLKEGLDLNAPGKNPTPLEDPIDDLVFQPTDLEGELSVVVSHAKSLRKASSWFAPDHSRATPPPSTSEGDGRLSSISEDGPVPDSPAPSCGTGPAKRPKFSYDSKLARSFNDKPISVLSRCTPTPQSLIYRKKEVAVVEEKKVEEEKEYNPDDPALPHLQSPVRGKRNTLNSEDDKAPDAKGKAAKGLGLEDKASLDAAKEIHVDSSLHPIEVERAKFLAKKKAKLKEGQDTVQEKETGLLISRNFASGKKKQLAKMREIDPDVREFLAIDEYKNKRRASFDMGEAKGMVTDASSGDLKFLLGRKYDSNYRYDIWDLIIDRVAIMSVCRSDESKLLSKSLAFDGSTSSRTELDLSDLAIEEIVLSLQPCSETAIGSRLTTPVRKSLASVKSVKSSRGTPSISKDLRSEKGYASITSQLKSEKKQKAVLQQASEKLKTRQADREKTHYTEVYRRVHTIPLMSNKFLDEDLCAKVIGNNSFTFGSTMQSWFEFFDKDGDGEISPNEFCSTMKELHTNMTDDAMSMLFMRFKSYGRRGLVDWKAFINFYEGGIKKKATDIEAAKDKDHLLHVLIDIVEKLLPFYMRKKQREVDGGKEEQKKEDFATSGAGEGKDEQEEGKLASRSTEDSGALEMTSLHVSQIRQNMHVLKTLHIDISYINMYRISRVFTFDLSKLKVFLGVCETITVTKPREAILETATEVTTCIMEAMKQRCAVNSKGFDFTSHEELSKLWFAMAPSLDSELDYPSLTQYFYDLFNGTGAGSNQQKAEGEANDSDEKKEENGSQEVSKLMPWGQQSTKVHHFHVIVYCNLIAEEIMFSRWNRNVNSILSKEIVSAISFTAFKAFIQQTNVDLIEQKLQYLVHLQECSDGGLVNYLVHGYIPVGTKDHLIFILYDPLSSSMFKLRVDGDVSAFPVEKALDDVLKSRYPHVPNVKKLAAHQMSKNYNSIETPVEDRTFTDLCSRFRLVNNGTQTTLTVAEDPKFVDKLKDLMEEANMPFFVIVNEISILFELSNRNAEEAGSMQKLVFGNIRKNRPLCNFLVNVMSDLRVVLRTYDGEKMENMEWVEMLAYLSGLRNPFVSVQLLPTYVEPEMGMVKHYPEELQSKYIDELAKYVKEIKAGGKDVGEKVSDIFQACKPADENDEVEVDEIFLPKVLTGPPDVDGGCHPTWDVPFKMKFRPPSLTSCPVRFTDICELYVEHEKKYMVIMVREAKDLSLFMTAYDPRSATEYMLFGGPPQWSLPGISSEEVFFEVFPCRDEKQLSREDAIQHQLDETIERHTSAEVTDPLKKLRLGFAITPRLVISVYNRSLSQTEELLGSCQISISSVLSGSGAHCRQWSTLMSEVYNKAGIPYFIEAGMLNVDLGYTKKAELDAIKQAKLEYVDRCKEKMNKAKANRAEADNSRTVEPLSKGVHSVKVLRSIRDGDFSSEDLVNLQSENAQLSNEVNKIKSEADEQLSEKDRTLRKQEAELKLLNDKLKQQQNDQSSDKPALEKTEAGRVNYAGEDSESSSRDLAVVRKKNEDLMKLNEELQKQVQTGSGGEQVKPLMTSGTEDSTDKLVANIAAEMCSRAVGEVNPQTAFMPLFGLSAVYQDANACLGAATMASIFAALQMKDVDEKQCEVGNRCNNPESQFSCRARCYIVHFLHSF